MSNTTKAPSTKGFKANDPNTSAGQKDPCEGVSGQLFPLCFPSSSDPSIFIMRGELRGIAHMRHHTHTVQFGLFLSTPKDKESRVHVRMWATGSKRKGKNERVGVIPNLKVRTRHWHKGGLTPTAPEEQHQLVNAVRSKLTALQAELTRKPRRVTAAYVRAYLWPAQRDMWGKLFDVAAGMSKATTAQRYRYSILSFQQFSKGEQPSPELFRAWVQHMANTSAPRTVNSYAGAVRSCCDMIGMPVQRSGLRVAEPDTKSGIALTAEELKALLELTLPTGSIRARVRDAFVCAALSSLRSVDWHLFTSANIGKEVLNEKTGKQTPIPDLPLVRQLIERNGGAIQLPKRMNEHLRRVAEQAAKACPSLCAEVEVRGKRVPRWYACVSHVARRTFVSNGWDNGVAPSDLMRFTGHSSEKQLLAYRRSTLTPQEQAAKDAEIAARVIVLDLGKPTKMKVAK